MKRRTTLVLGIAAAVLVGGAFLLARGRGVTPDRAPGERFAPELSARAAEIGVVEVKRGNATVRLERQPDERWIVASSDGFPARGELVRALVVSVGALTLEDPMTAKKSRHSEMGLAWPDDAGKTRLVRFLGLPGAAAPGAAPIAEVVLGEERFNPDAVFVRRADQDQTWRARGRIQVPMGAIDWMDTRLFELPAGETKRASLAGLTLTRPRAAAPAPGAPAPGWDAEIAPGESDHWSPAQVASAQTGLTTFLDRLEFEGVRRAHADAAAEPAWSPSFETEGALVDLLGHHEADGIWFTVAITPKPNAPKVTSTGEHDGDPFIPDYAALGKRLAGWEFRMPEWKMETLKRIRSEAPAIAAPPG